MGGIVLFSDPHFSNRSAFGKFESNSEFPGCNSRFHHVAKAFRTAVDYAVDNDCESIFILGDVFHDRGMVEIPVYNATYQLFKECTSRGIALRIYPGNHDLVDLRAMHVTKHLHSLFMYEKIAYVYEKPTIVDTAYFQVLVAPFSNSSAYLLDATTKLADKMSGDIKMLMLHHSVNGAITGPHEWVMEHRLDAKAFSDKFTHKWSGHYHFHQEVEGLWYVGGPVHHDFGERNYVPGFIHVSPDGTWKHIENVEAPRFQVIETKDPLDLTNIPSNNYVSIKWTGDIGEIENLKKTLPENCIIEFKNTVTLMPARTTIKTTDAVEDMITKFAKAKLTAVSDSDEYTKHGITLYKGK